MAFTSSTTGTITEPGNIVHNLTLANGIASVTVDGIGTFNYKLLTLGTDSLVLGQTDTDLTIEMNGSQDGPPPIWALKSTTATADALPTSGSMTLWSTSTDNFGDKNNSAYPKIVFNFDNNTATGYFIDGTANNPLNFTMSQDGKTMHTDQSATNSRVSDIQLMDISGNFLVFEDHYSDNYTWGQGSAGGAADMSAYLTVNNDVLWNENGIDRDGNGSAYDYGMVTRSGGVVSGFTAYNSNMENHSDQTQQYAALSATLTNGTLVIDEGDQTQTYSIASDEVNIQIVGVEVLSMTTNNPFSYTYA